MDVARAKLGETRFSVEWAEGYAMSLEPVMQSVLGKGQHTALPKPSTSTTRTPGPSDTLTRRELEVAKLVAMGYTDRQIADELTITEGTAGIHVHHILES